MCFLRAGFLRIVNFIKTEKSANGRERRFRLEMRFECGSKDAAAIEYQCFLSIRWPFSYCTCQSMHYQFVMDEIL